MTKDQLKVIIGENIRNERILRKISIDELAEMLDLTSGFVGLIERGQRGTTTIALYKLAGIFGLSIDSFFRQKRSMPIEMGEEYISKKQIKRKKIESLISDFTENELDFVISVVKSVRVLNSTDGERVDSIYEGLFDEDSLIENSFIEGSYIEDTLDEDSFN